MYNGKPFVRLVNVNSKKDRIKLNTVFKFNVLLSVISTVWLASAGRLVLLLKRMTFVFSVSCAGPVKVEKKKQRNRDLERKQPVL